jgi:hypothetical protein
VLHEECARGKSIRAIDRTKCHRLQIDVEVLALDRPLLVRGVFNTAASRPACRCR